MKNSNSQSGVGLIEVMVALLLLAVAVLGFSALNMVSVKATDDSVLIANANQKMSPNFTINYQFLHKVTNYSR